MIGTSVVGALIVGETVADLPDPVEIILPLLNAVRFKKVLSSTLYSFHYILPFRTSPTPGVSAGVLILQVPNSSTLANCSAG